MNVTYTPIPCCLCGAMIQPNNANMCVQCLRSEVDITEGIARSESLLTCKSCGRFRGAHDKWMICEPESHELLALCLKHISGLGKGKSNAGGSKSGVRLKDANWIWTEPHSRRLKVKLVLERDLMNGANVRQSMVTEFHVRTQMCPFCAKEDTNQQWTTVVQVRQKVDHKRTMLFLEQMLLKHRATTKVHNLEIVTSGINFYFVEKSHANKFADFVMQTVPAKRKESKSLQSTDINNNKQSFKFTISLEIMPVCKFDLAILPPKLQNSMGLRTQLVLCSRVTRCAHFVDPFTGSTAELRENKFWANPFRPIAAANHMVEMIVLDVTLDDETDRGKVHGKDGSSMADVEVVLASDFGENDTQHLVRSHLGHVLQPGDTVLGYYLEHVNLSEDDLNRFKGKNGELPSIVLVQKKRPPKKRGRRKNKKKKDANTGSGVGGGESQQAEAGDPTGASLTNNELLDRSTAAEMFQLSQAEVDLTMEEFEGLDVNDDDGEAVEDDDDVQNDASHVQLGEFIAERAPDAPLSD